ncbi:HU family DNA-binding protein [Chelatococcus sambhunathii]|nr:HU family DNA-binding protein [Chelatococcus sambhunathii]
MKGARLFPEAATPRGPPDSQRRNSMNKSDLISEVADKSGLTKLDAAKAVDATFDAVIAALKKGDEVRLVGFGTFQVVKRAAGVGRNLRTGETIKIPASKTPKFKAGQALKDAVNG